MRMVGREGSALALRNPAIREVGIYKRKQESKKTRKHAFDQESDQEKKGKKERKHALDQDRNQEKRKTLFLFLLLSFFLL